MAEQEYDIYKLNPKPRLNYTDPIIRHDPTIEKQTIVKPDITDNSDENIDGSAPNIDMKKIDAIEIPVILLNNTVVNVQNIVSMTLTYDSFVPTIKLIIQQFDNEIELSDTPGLDNIITVVMTSRVNGAYKPISLNFYINSVKVVDNELYYFGTYKLLALEQNKTEQIVFFQSSSWGCPDEFCKLPPNEHPTTFEFLHEIAETCKLGYATTDQVKEINDDKYRFITNQNYKDAIIQHVEFGGLDENSIFDAWIDPYGYLVVVNVPWVLNEKVELEDIGIFAEYSSQAADQDISDHQESMMMQRILTNYSALGQFSNFVINKHKWITNNKAIREHGSSNQYIMGSPMGYTEEGNNAVFPRDIDIIGQNSQDKEYRDGYDFQKTSFIGFEMGNAEDGNTPVLIQKRIRDNYFRKLRQRRLKVELNMTNMGLQRGTLVFLMMVEYDDSAKRRILSAQGMTDAEVRELIETSSVPVINTNLSGFWYIDGMEFTYEMETKMIVQSLYLIKKDPYENLNSKTNPDINKVNETT